MKSGLVKIALISLGMCLGSVMLSYNVTPSKYSLRFYSGILSLFFHLVRMRMARNSNNVIQMENNESKFIQMVFKTIKIPFYTIKP